MNLDNKFTALQLAIINEQAALYNCACPVHVSVQIANLRKLFDYQKMCMELDRDSLSENQIEIQVHHRIAEVTKQAHHLMEQCLDEILDMEGWDRAKLEMPAGIRKRTENN
jgi:hypothetical protein